MLDFPTARARLAALDVPRQRERVAAAAALGRVLAAPVAMDRDQPGFDRATMDGYACVLPGDGARFAVRGSVAAGAHFAGVLAPGEAVRIMTGVPVPAGATVVPVEVTEASGEHVTVTEPAALAPGRNVAWRGEDARAGDVVLAAGTRLGPVHLAAAAMAGAATLEVAVPPRLAVVNTGDEVGREDADGVRDTNGPLLTALAAALGVPCTRQHARDDLGALTGALSAALDSADIVVTTGGVSMGDKDFVPAVAARLGLEVVLHRVAIQPGKPVFVARRSDGKLLLGLPGNPVSVLATAHLFLVPLIDRALGADHGRWLSLPLADDFQHAGRRHLFLPARIVRGHVEPIRWNGSGDLFSAAAGDGLLDLPVGATFAAGAAVDVLPYVGHTSGVRGVLPPRGARP